MKILILTHPLELNYGGILQNYALQSVLLDMGHDVMTIDVHHDKSILYKILSYVSRFFRHYLLKQKNIPTQYDLNKRGVDILRSNPNINRFIQKNIHRTKYISSYKKLNEVLSYSPDCIVVGSDQVWLEQYFPYTLFSFAQHYCCKKIVYAASGSLSWLDKSNKIDYYKTLIKGIDAISVREYSMVEKCESIFDVVPTLVLDPVFLLPVSKYVGLLDKKNIDVRNILATYVLDENKGKEVFIKKIATALGLNIIKTKTVDSSNAVLPLEYWLESIICAKFIVTDSFHGMVLSIIFNKQFFVIGNKKRGLDRFVTVLRKLGLIDRLLYEDDLGNNIIEDLIQKKIIDYDCVNDILNKDREYSLMYLRKSLE